jgi:hypothetical protein
MYLASFGGVAKMGGAMRKNSKRQTHTAKPPASYGRTRPRSKTSPFLYVHQKQPIMRDIGTDYDIH